MRRFGVIVALFMAGAAGFPYAVAAQGTPCRFILGFADLAAQLGTERIGACVEDQRSLTGAERFTIGGQSFRANAGDAMQWTTKGVLLWSGAEGNVAFFTSEGLYFPEPEGGVSYLSWSELATAGPMPSPTARVVPAVAARPTQTPIPAAQTDQRTADSRCFSMASTELISSVNFAGTAAGQRESERRKAQAEAISYLCGQAADRYGTRGVDCFQQAWDAARGMERVFQGSGRQVYDEEFATCIAAR